MNHKANSIQRNDAGNYFFADLTYFLTFSVRALRTKSRQLSREHRKYRFFMDLEDNEMTKGRARRVLLNEYLSVICDIARG